MCAVSMIIDHYDDEWNKKYRPWKYVPSAPAVWPIIPDPNKKRPLPPTDEEIDEFRRLLERAREYDKRNSEPDCELESKKDKIRALAEELGIGDKIDFI